MYSKHNIPDAVVVVVVVAEDESDNKLDDDVLTQILENIAGLLSKLGSEK